MCKKRLQVLFGLLSVIVLSCQKTPVTQQETEKPLTAEYNAASFTLSLIEKRATEVEFPWEISSTGQTKSITEGINDLYITSVNTTVLSVKGGDGYNGVNVASSDPNVVRVEYLGKEKTTSNDSYSLIYVADGTANIDVWNGSGSKMKKTSFNVKALKYIVPEELVLVMDEGTEMEKDIIVKKWFDDSDQFEWPTYFDACAIRVAGTWVDVPLDQCNVVLSEEEYNLDMTDYNPYTVVDYVHLPKDKFPPKIIHSLKVKTIRPENTSFRYVKFETESLKKALPFGWLDYLTNNGYVQNWTNGYNGDFSNLNNTFYFGAFRAFTKRLSLGEFTFLAPAASGSPIKIHTAVIFAISDYEVIYGYHE